ncbi:MAG TPA: sugar phosphate isomerase/epimerase [Acidobacteriaceae bacterium]|nr:sugar phosphate isomerase/epimerase [Acidobacteriaceae bacterium]
MTSRRDFLKSSAALACALALNDNRVWGLVRIPLGVQLYTVRQVAEKNLPETLAKIRKIGYQEVETYGGIYTYPAAQLQYMIQQAGLAVPSGHFDYDTLVQQLPYANQLGLKWVVCPMIPHSMWTLEGFHAAAKQLNEFGKRAQALGMRFAFHNHNYEFADYGGGKTGYEILVAETDPELVFFELDCYWAVQAGHDPLRMMERMGKRIRMLHLKDRKPGFPISYDMGPSSAHFVPVGKGSIDWRPILAEGERLEIEHYFVEQDDTYGHPFKSISESYKDLLKLMA